MRMSIPLILGRGVKRGKQEAGHQLITETQDAGLGQIPISQPTTDSTPLGPVLPIILAPTMPRNAPRAGAHGVPV